MWDIRKFFDRESLREVMNEVYKIGIRGKIYSLIYEMNRNTIIAVKTPVGVPEEYVINEGIAQGASVSVVNLTMRVIEFFMDSADEICYAGLEMMPIMYHHDVATSLSSVQSGNTRLQPSKVRVYCYWQSGCPEGY